MDLSVFQTGAPGVLVDISGTDPTYGDWKHRAFVPDPLPDEMPELRSTTFLTVAEARASLAALDATSRRLPNPTLLRQPTLRREAQSTSALEGTYAPFAEVFTADDEDPGSTEMNEILNYVTMASTGFSRISAGWPLTAALVRELQGALMRGLPLEPHSGNLRTKQVVVGRRSDVSPATAPVFAARFVPPPPGADLTLAFTELIEWIGKDHSGRIDPVVAAALAHYQFETLHPFVDGNGRLGRYLVVLHLLLNHVLSEPTLRVSGWFEARRAEYYDRLLAVSTHGDWDSYVRFFAEGLRQSADVTRIAMLALTEVQADLHSTVRSSRLRAENAHALVDLAVANPSFTVAKVQAELGVTYTRANGLVGQLVDLGILRAVNPSAHKRRFYAPRVLDVLR